MKKTPFILIVDDDDVACFITMRTLELLAIASKIETLNNGREAADFFTQKHEKYPDLVLLDINMPLMNGFEFLDWYEKNGHTGTTKFAMYTSSERPEERKKAEGYEDVIGYISKPINKEKIEEVMINQ